jgi:hypothetical protein
MCGIGIYLHANGDRYEGMFVGRRRYIVHLICFFSHTYITYTYHRCATWHAGNKLDGPGSMYTYDAASGREEARHAVFSAGMKGKELAAPFVPKVIDLPENHLADKLVAMGLLADEESGKSSKRSKIDEMFHAKSDAHDWKKKLGKYLRLKASEAREFSLIPRADRAADEGSEDDSRGSGSDSEEEGGGDGEWAADEQGDSDDVGGYHFVDIPGLFVAYAYVTAAAKVLESREVTRQLHKMPDFEEVYHLVVDAVDAYNEAWENEFRKTHLGGDAAASVAAAANTETVQSKKHMYMSAVRHTQYLLSLSPSLSLCISIYLSICVCVSLSRTHPLSLCVQAQVKDEVLEKQRQELALKQVCVCVCVCVCVRICLRARICIC